MPAALELSLLREPIGTHFVQVCTTTPCMLRGSTEILNTCLTHLGGINPGQTTTDGKFTVIEVECQGACSNAPMMVVGDDFYVSYMIENTARGDLTASQEDLTVETTKKVLDAFRKGHKPKPGPQSGRHTSENSAGLTALTSKAGHRALEIILSSTFQFTSLMDLENIVYRSFSNMNGKG